jgi:hypothetical protein
MAGNIIPAIATTNAIIAGIIVLQTLHLLRQSYERLSLTFLQTKHNKPLNGSRPMVPNPNCAICQDTYTTVRCDPARTTLRNVVEGVLGPGDGHGTGARDVGVYEAGRILADPDFEDNLDRTLADLNCGRGKFITVVDEDGVYGTINVAICLLPCVAIFILFELVLTVDDAVVTPTYRRPTPLSSSFPTHFPSSRSNRGRRPHLGRYTSGRREKTTTTGSLRLLDLGRRPRKSREQQTGMRHRILEPIRHPRCRGLKRRVWCS